MSRTFGPRIENIQTEYMMGRRAVGLNALATVIGTLLFPASSAIAGNVGACCAPLGCIDGLTSSECAAIASATYLGDGATCLSELATCPTGACCLQGQCVDGVPPGGHFNQAGCEGAGGGYLGDGSTCASANTTCEGACCLPQGCIETTVEGCASAGGTYLGNDTTCESQQATCPTGACCLQGQCLDGIPPSGHFNQAGCEGAGGGYLGDGSTCATANTTCRGACCLPQGCIETTVEGCASAGGTYLGNDTTCESQQATCPTGACCLQGQCIDGVPPSGHFNQAGCEGAGGGYLGDASTCATANTTCRGACCFPTGCIETTLEGCVSSFGGGTYLGNDTTCESQIADCPTGACCIQGECNDTFGLGSHANEAGCQSVQGAIYVGDGSTCATTPTCEIGACTTCCECTQVTEEDCAGIGGEFHGVGVTCASLNFVPDTTPPDITCPEPVTLDRGDRLCALGAGHWLSSATATDDCGETTITTSAPECGFPYGSTTTVTFTATDECGNSRTCTSDITIGPAPRVDISKKGSLLAFSKVDLRWNAAGALTQDTFITLLNDYPADVYVQMYFVNGGPGERSALQQHPAARASRRG